MAPTLALTLAPTMNTMPLSLASQGISIPQQGIQGPIQVTYMYNLHLLEQKHLH